MLVKHEKMDVFFLFTTSGLVLDLEAFISVDHLKALLVFLNIPLFCRCWHIYLG